MDKLYHQISSADKKKIFFEKGFHEPFLDDEIEQYKSHVVKWLNNRLDTRFRKRKPPVLASGELKRVKVGYKGEKKFTKIKVLISVFVFVLYFKGLCL